MYYSHNKHNLHATIIPSLLYSVEYVDSQPIVTSISRGGIRWVTQATAKIYWCRRNCIQNCSIEVTVAVAGVAKE